MTTRQQCVPNLKFAAFFQFELVANLILTDILLFMIAISMKSTYEYKKSNLRICRKLSQFVKIIIFDQNIVNVYCQNLS